MEYAVIVVGLVAVGDTESQSHQPSFARRVGIGMQSLHESGGDDTLWRHQLQLPRRVPADAQEFCAVSAQTAIELSLVDQAADTREVNSGFVRTTRMTVTLFKWDRMALTALWLAGLVLLAAGFCLNDPYLAAVRSRAPVLIVLSSATAVSILLACGIWTRGRILGKLLVALWCALPFAAASSEITFQLRKRNILHAEGPAVKDLGQHFIIGYQRAEDIALLVVKGLIGGIYVTHHNIKGRTADELKAEIAGFQEMRRAAGLPPLVVAADQEGGIVSHLSPQLRALPALSTLADLQQDERIRTATQFGTVHGRELADIGVTLNFAPVVDVGHPRQRNRLDFNSLIGQRAISSDPSIIAEVASAYIHGLNTSDVRATIKHFPGLGRVDEDTHHFRGHLKTPASELEITDWLPFRELLRRQQTHMMVGHVVLDAIDPDRPASHSKRVINDLVRERWGYQGVIVTDDMVMGAVYQHGICGAVVEAINAGVDLLLVAFDGRQYYRIFTCALAASAEGRLDPAMLAKSRDRLRKTTLRDTSQASM
jgi:beta-N-acetylhexosaminidase